MELIFWIFVFVFLYTYAGYPLLLLLFKRKASVCVPEEGDLPTVTVLVAAYNEAALISKKIENSFALSYPAELLNIVVVADGSTDATPDIVRSFSNVTLLFEAERKGKSAAINRALNYIHSDIVVMTDANCFLASGTLEAMIPCFNDATVGAVAGSKKVVASEEGMTDGEGIYWKYESSLKQLESDFFSVIGAAGELVAFRRACYTEIPAAAITDDFYLSLSINLQGMRVVYAPKATGMESASLSLKDEWNRKVRIAAGGIQSLFYFSRALNPFLYPRLAFQFISHRFFRWVLAAPALAFIFLSNVWLTVAGAGIVYTVFLALQLAFYLCALLGYVLYDRAVKSRFLQLPFYFVMMHAAQPVGAIRYFTGKQTSVWKKAQRAD